MKKISICIYLLIIIFLSTIWCHTITTNVVHIEAKDPWKNGFWQKKIVWKPRWVKSWQQKKLYIAVWKKVWGPIEMNEWVPLPKPPPGWTPPEKHN